MSNFPYKHVLVVGATSGIGHAMAERLVANGCKVVVAGRRQELLDAFVRTHGEEKASAVQLDLSDTASFDKFVEGITSSFPSLDAVWLNAGVQKPLNLAEPEKFEMKSFHQELHVNYTAQVELIVRLLPHLIKKSESVPAAMIYTGTNIAQIPFSFVPGYSASKTALNVFFLCLREQVRDTKLKVIEVSPPAVQSELHDYMGQERGRQLGMPMKDFVDSTWSQLAEGSDQIIVDPIADFRAKLEDIATRRRQGTEELAARVRAQRAAQT